MKNVNSTQENLCVLFTFLKREGQILVQFLFLLLSFAKENLCVLFTFFKTVRHKYKNIIKFLFVLVSFAKENLCVLFTFFKRLTHKQKNITSISFFVGAFCKGKSLCTVYLFQKSNTQILKCYFNFFSLLFSRLG